MKKLFSIFAFSFVVLFFTSVNATAQVRKTNKEQVCQLVGSVMQGGYTDFSKFCETTKYKESCANFIKELKNFNINFDTVKSGSEEGCNWTITKVGNMVTYTINTAKTNANKLSSLYNYLAKSAQTTLKKVGF